MTGAASPVEAIRELLTQPRQIPLMFVTVGSDHHRFDRLIEWVDSWISASDTPVHCVMQVGTASPPQNGIAVDYLDHALLEALLGGSDVVVVQGGPMSIVETQRAGRRPIVVPRLARLAEVVDDHQVTFCRRLAQEDRIDLAEDKDTLHRALTAAVLDPSRLIVGEDVEGRARTERAVARFGSVADGTVRAPGGSRTRVVMLGGAGRSGSTLLERMVAGVPGVAALGEVIHVWERGFDEDQLCGCALPFSECAFWSLVVATGFQDWTAEDTRGAVSLRRQVERTRHAAGLLGLTADTAWRLRRNSLQRLLLRLYGSCSEVSGARVLVDSSKHPAHALLLRRLPIDLRCILVVRDPRAVAYSWQKSVERPELRESRGLMPRYGVARSALTWNLFAFMCEALSWLKVPMHVVRYEDLIARPREVLAEVLAFAGVEPADGDLDHVGADSVMLEPSHTVAGNPMRFESGRIGLKVDDEWRDGLSRPKRGLVAALTAPARWRYGYQGH